MKYWRLALGVCISAALVWGLLHFIAAGNIWSVLRHADLKYVLLAVLFLGVDYVVRSLRWWLMLRRLGAPTTFASANMVLLAGFAINNVLPFRAGDVMRAVSFSDRMKSRSSHLVGTLVLERGLDLVGLLACCVAVLSGSNAGTLHPALMRKAGMMAGAGAVLLLGSMFLSRTIERILLRITGVAIKNLALRERVDRALSSILQVFKDTNPAFLAQMLGLSCLAWALESVVFFAATAAVGVHAGIQGPLLALAMGNLAAIIPSAPGYIGTFDVGVTAALVTSGVSSSGAAAVAVMSHAILWVPVTLAGMLCLLILSHTQQRQPLRAEAAAVRVQ